MTPIPATEVPVDLPPPPPMYSPEHRTQFIGSMLAELAHAYAKHGARPWSRHEFYAVLKEEVDELWDAVKQDEGHSKEKGKSLPDRKDGACPDKTQVFDSLQTRDLVNSNLGTIASPRQDRERSRGREGNIGQVENSTDSTKATSSSHPSCSKSAQGRAVSKVQELVH